MRYDAKPPTKLCRAYGCRRRIESTNIFCSTHFPMLTPRYQDPIIRNREAPIGADRAIARAIGAAASEAVKYLADLEGNRLALEQATKTGATVQTGGSDTNSAPSGGGSDREFGTIKVQEL